MNTQQDPNTAQDPNSTSEPTTEFDIPDIVRETHPKLVEMILATESMDADEKQYWFHILPIMKEDQIKQLNTILTTEKDKLAEIEKKYASQGGSDEQVSAARSNFSEEDFKKEKQALEAAENAAESAEDDEEAQLLKEIENF